MRIRIDDRDGFGAAIYVELIGTKEELNEAKDWCRERWSDDVVHPYQHNSQYHRINHPASDRYHTTIQFWERNHVMLFKLTWA